MDLGFISAPFGATVTNRHRPAISPRSRMRAVAPRWRASTVAETSTETQTETEWVAAEDMSKSAQKWPTVLGIEDIMKILPHRYPFLLIDRVVAYEPGKRAIAIKNVSMNEPQFTGHFPDKPIMPGVLQVEALAQVGGIVMLQQPMSDGKGDFFFGGVDKVKWRKPVLPGDTLVMEMTLTSYKPRFGIAKMEGRAYCDGALVCEGLFTLVMVVDKKN